MNQTAATFRPGGAGSAAISVRGLSCRYGDLLAVDDLSLEVAAGEFFALLGTNGAGKTTTLETMQGHRLPSTGTVEMMGIDVHHDRLTALRHCGIMLQETGYAEELTVHETVRLLGRLSGRKDQPDRVIELAGLLEKRDVRVGRLSGGQRRRLDFAVAIYGEPDVLFLDEPTTALDPQARERLWQVVDGLRANGTTVVLTTHYIEEAQRYADRVAIMDRGVVVETGPVDRLLEQRPSRITFRVPTDAPRPPLGAATDARGHVELESDDPTRDLSAVLSWASHAGVRLHDLEVTRARLEDLFIEVGNAQHDHAA